MDLITANRLQSLRKKNGFSQDALAEKIGVSRQSISKWERAEASPDMDNIVKLSQLYGVSIDEMLYGEPVVNTPESKQEKKGGKKRGWLFISYPIIMAIIYAIIGSAFSAQGWMYGWIVFLTIPLFYTTISAVENKNPTIFCYPVLVVIIFLLAGFFKGLWHPMWIIFLTIPLFYIITSKIKKPLQK